jgi:hypothetical protein
LRDGFRVNMSTYRTPISLPGDPENENRKTRAVAPPVNLPARKFSDRNGEVDTTEPYGPVVTAIAIYTRRFPWVAAAVVAARMLWNASAAGPAMQMVYAQDSHDVARRNPRVRDAIQQGVDRFEHRELRDQIEGRGRTVIV